MSVSAISYRPFRNTDPPALVDIWNAQPRLQWRAQPLSAPLVERFVLSKPYFDPRGLILAVEEDEPVGFVHAGFGPAEEPWELAHRRGVTCMLLIKPRAQQEEVAQQLLKASETYLREQGAAILLGGATPPLAPFYLGLYGGSQLSGILASDAQQLGYFQAAGYRPVQRRLLFQCRLDGFRPPVDRNQMMCRRQYRLELLPDPQPADWWDACAAADGNRIQFRLLGKDNTACAYLTLWDLEPLASSWNMMARGLVKVYTEPALRRRGLGTFLMSEALRQLHKEGVSLVAAQSEEDDLATTGLLRKLGFEQVDEGIMLEKAQ